jgi:Peptidase S46
MTRCTGGLLLAALLLAPAARADEGMWLFNKPPRKLLKEKYRFDATDKWLEHVQKSSVRFNSGGSGSFVSADGLVMTNHHVGADALQKLSDKDGVDYVKNGFHARTRDQEKKAIGIELNVLMSIEDVTDQVKGAVKANMSSAEAFAARRAVIAKIEADSLAKTKLRSDVVTLYQGGQYHLYRYKKYTDVRLVFAPEKQAAFFGGDPDNFEYPRYDLDICFFRVYEDGKPAKLEHHLKWSPEGAKDGELIFVSGHPGRTDRLNTVAELDYLRDTGFPYLLQRLYRWEVLLSVYSGRSTENARKAEDFLFGVANSRKARNGGLAGLLDPSFMKKKMASEKQLKEAVAKDEKLKDAAKAWATVAQAQKVRTTIMRRYTVLEGGAGFNSDLFGIARRLVRAAEERPKPNPERLTEYSNSRLPSLEHQLFSDEKLFDDYEMVKLADGLTFLVEQLGYRNPLVQKVLAGKSPRERATELIQGTKLKEVAERKRLYKGGAMAIAASKDPMIALAKLVDKDSRAVRKTYETQVQEPSRQAYAQIAKAKYAVEGDSTYPDATFTLRLAFGTVKGYTENGKKIPPFTQMGGLYERAAAHDNKYPFNIPPRWLAKKDRLNLKTPFNFVSTADIIGGNSGSPVINRNAEVVGIIFDGNIQSLVLDFAYTDKVARAVSVASQGILEALRKVYDANELVAELTGSKKVGSKK